MSPIKTEVENICVCTEGGDTVGWLCEDHARHLIHRHKATLISKPGAKRRKIMLIASESEPLRGKSRAMAAAGYSGHEKYTYDEPLPNAGHSIVMLKRHRPNVGDFVRW